MSKVEQLTLDFLDNKPQYIVNEFSANNFWSDIERKKLEEKYFDIIDVTSTFNRQSVSYQLSKKDALHSWLKYKEGFSAYLVDSFLDEMDAQKGDLIMDPFMGSGTTALVCQMRNINSIGYDILPLSKLSISVKSNALSYNISELKEMLLDLVNLEVPKNYQGKTPYISITEYAYPEQNEKFIQFVTDWNRTNKYPQGVKDLLSLCIVNSLESISYTAKSGQYLSWDCRSKKVIQANIERAKKGQRLLPTKYVRENIADAKSTILTEVGRVLLDIESIQRDSSSSNSATLNFIENSVLYELPKLDDSILKGVITSPPYCNRYDYTRTYALELAYLGLTDFEVKTLRQRLLSCTVESHSKLLELSNFYELIGKKERYNTILSAITSNSALQEVLAALQKRKENGDLNNNGVIRMVEGYFTELAFIFGELFRICKPGANVVFVNDNVRYGGEVIPVDTICTSLAEQFGFKAKKIYTLKQQKGNSSQQMAKFGRIPLRKSITVWVKE